MGTIGAIVIGVRNRHLAAQSATASVIRAMGSLLKGEGTLSAIMGTPPVRTAPVIATNAPPRPITQASHGVVLNTTLIEGRVERKAPTRQLAGSLAMRREAAVESRASRIQNDAMGAVRCLRNAMTPQAVTPTDSSHTDMGMNGGTSRAVGAQMAANPTWKHSVTLNPKGPLFGHSGAEVTGGHL